ncbi:MAG: hypothetical protein ABJA02_16415 [Acidobacteriota bacterium]
MNENQTAGQDRRPSDIEGNWSGSDVEGSNHDETGRNAESEETADARKSGFDAPPWRPTDQHQSDVVDESAHPDTSSGES